MLFRSCWKIEDAGARSDRIYRSGEDWAQNSRQDIIQALDVGNITPRYVEVNFNQACNFKCMYCSPHLSTTWEDEIKKYGPLQIENASGVVEGHNDVTYLDKQGLMPLKVKQADNPYLLAFWRWWPELYKKLGIIGGYNWTTRTSGTTSIIYSLTYGNGIYVYGGWGGVLATSTDGTTWTAQASGSSTYIFALTYGNGLFVYVGSTGASGTSTNAITWTSLTAPTSNALNAVTYGNGLYVYGGYGALATSAPNQFYVPAFSNQGTFGTVTTGYSQPVLATYVKAKY